MHTNNFKHLFLLLGLTISACTSGSEDAVFNNPASKQLKPTVKQINVTGGQSLGDSKKAATPLVDVEYLMFLFSANDTELCQGNVAATIYSDFNLKIPTAAVECLSLKIDLSSMLANVGAGKIGVDDLSSDGKITKTSRFGKVAFDPPRPMFIGPIVQDEKIFANLNETIKTTATIKSDTGAVDKTADGQFNVVVNSPQDSANGSSGVFKHYENDYGPDNKFDRVLHWTMSATGFDGISAADGLIFKRSEFFWNTRPIMIPKMVIVGDLKGFIGTADPTAAAASDIIGDVRVELRVKSYKIGS